jgi:hypothetical protein
MNMWISQQTSQVFLGAAVALLYTGAVLGLGFLALAAFLDRTASLSVRERVGLAGYGWLGFVVGQGILGVVWLSVSLAGIFHAWLVWIACGLGWALLCMQARGLLKGAAQDVKLIWASSMASVVGRSWYFWVGTGVVVSALLLGLMALLPTSNDDALRAYLPTAKTIADTQALALQPFIRPIYALLPLQVEMHWAALFAISNETAVTTWDYICALSFLAGIGLLGWALTASRRVSLVAALLMLSTPGLYQLVGGGKVDNAAAQFGIATFLCL